MIEMEFKMVDGNLLEQIELSGQRHVLQFWDQLSAVEQAKFAEQLASLDWKLVAKLLSEFASSQSSGNSAAGIIAPPAHVIRKPKSEAEHQVWHRARELGEEALRAGQVGAILLAGGQGTRLGFPHPKGKFPIGPVSGKSLFEILAEQIVSLSDRFGRSIPYLVMTSDGTHDETVAFFKQHDHFGLDRDNIFFFQQGYAPSLDAHTGKLLLANKGQLSMNPDGHGGLLAALLKAGLFDNMRERGIEYLFSHQVDNPLVKACDPEFIGLHIANGADVSTKVVAKTGSDEKVGVAVSLNGQTAIIEYSDLSSELANETDTSGELRYWAGSTAIHLFNRSLLESVATSVKNLPWHRAVKKVPCVDQAGQIVEPQTENAVKFERFLFDTLPLAKTALIVETLRDEEFAPLKNSTGEFSAEYVRDRMIQVAVNWLKSAGVKVPESTRVEISPRFAMSGEALAAHSDKLQHLNFDQPLFLEPEVTNTRPRKSAPDTTSSVTPSLDPLVFDSYYRPQVWGGRGLNSHLDRSLPQEGPYGEAWDLSPHALHVSRVVEGPLSGRDINDLWAHCRRQLTGHTGGGVFPLLIKWLECRELLSLQVHPDDRMAQCVLNEPYGKSEAWIVIAVEPTARVFAGLKPGVTRADVVAHLNDGTLVDCLHSFVPRPGACISLPAGTIHAAGGGLLVAEVQQSSDATFRLFDWNRLGLDGTPRALHIERALEAVDWSQGPVAPVIPVKIETHSPGVWAEKLVDGTGFRLERYSAERSFTSPHAGEMTIWMVLDGTGELHSSATGFRRVFHKGETTLIPAAASGLVWQPHDTRQILTLLCIRLQNSTN